MDNDRKALRRQTAPFLFSNSCWLSLNQLEVGFQDVACSLLIYGMYGYVIY